MKIKNKITTLALLSVLTLGTTSAIAPVQSIKADSIHATDSRWLVTQNNCVNNVEANYGKVTAHQWDLLKDKRSDYKKSKSADFDGMNPKWATSKDLAKYAKTANEPGWHFFNHHRYARWWGLGAFGVNVKINVNAANGYHEYNHDTRYFCSTYDQWYDFSPSGLGAPQDMGRTPAFRYGGLMIRGAGQFNGTPYVLVTQNQIEDKYDTSAFSAVPLQDITVPYGMKMTGNITGYLLDGFDEETGGAINNLHKTTIKNNLFYESATVSKNERKHSKELLVALDTPYKLDDGKNYYLAYEDVVNGSSSYGLLIPEDQLSKLVPHKVYYQHVGSFTKTKGTNSYNTFKPKHKYISGWDN
ncbi:hypothetical protein [Lactobacillus sp. ESL0677]|uniref:hypothetical protein n=1 Tax=Lactobacillus sp. ESL0677 TaxID=2983208 RepID=UPI0023F9F15D|nr:hypothetical protein [Lactobacillus sp. ESL0677]WEV37562.1 hypothetical protein OZX76_03135 [Lactobacillus sp. ESL0677]